jgi:hypothetical protein
MVYLWIKEIASKNIQDLKPVGMEKLSRNFPAKKIGKTLDVPVKQMDVVGIYFLITRKNKNSMLFLIKKREKNLHKTGKSSKPLFFIKENFYLQNKKYLEK